jgi:hypothetical protein
VLIDTYMPECDGCERHTIHVQAPPERIYAALRSANLAASPVVRFLFALRALPAAIQGGRAGVHAIRAHARAPIRLADFERHGFSILDENAPNELLIGLEGRFWSVSGGLRRVDPASFRALPPAGLARAAWNFRIEPRPDGSCLLSTETRVRCSDSTTRRRFRLYWLLIRPGSGVIRRHMLQAIRQAAESNVES